MGQNAPIGTQVGPSAAPKPQTPAPSGVYQPPPPGTLGALSNRMRQPQPSVEEIVKLLLARQFPQFMGHAPTAQSFDLANAPVQQDDLMQTLMQRGQ